MNKKLIIHTLSITDEAYPEGLRSIPSPPKKLWYIGDVTILNEQHILSVVGSRKVSVYGRSITTSLVESVARYGVLTVSGLALGIDSLAHTASLKAGERTIAVLPCGLDDICPRTHRELAIEIIRKGGLLVSEYPPGTPPLRQHFIARNRIVSGIGHAVLIPEAAIKSGTLHTAQFGLEQGRTVMAVPGNITSPMSAGTNALIKSGAVAVTDADDILMALGITAKEQVRSVLAANPEEESILMLLQEGVSDGGALHLGSGLDAARFGQTLTMLEITGKIRPLGAGHWTLSQ